MDHRELKFAFYGDDFTGATDTLSTLATAGLSTLLFMGPPTAAQLGAAGPLDCLGIAGAARAMRRSEQEVELEPIARFFAQLAAPVTHYKTCSTFDSSVELGSIGTALRVFRKHLNAASFLPIVGGQPSLGRYCVFGNLFAAFQAGGSAYRLDRHPTMSGHPVTPMHESDLRLHLAAQGQDRIGLVEYPQYDLAPDDFDVMLGRQIANNPDGVLFDVGHAAHLPVVGRAIWQHASRQALLAAGPSSVAQALIAHWQASEVLKPASQQCALAQIDDAAGPVFALSGSRSPLTAAQIDAAASYQRIPVDASVLMGQGSPSRAALLAMIHAGLSQGRNVLVYLMGGAGANCGAAAPTPADLAKSCAALLADVLEVARPRRVGIAGGDTSSYAVRALDVWGLSYLGQLDAGVALCRMHSDNPQLQGVEIMLKGGQMGSESIFEKLLSLH
jgi:uncharacterized protein YgbK (DUF1537 family)